MSYPIHPLAELLPPMTAEEYAALKQSIQEQGQLEPIVCQLTTAPDGTQQWGPIIDGRHREQVCAELRITPSRIRKYFDNDAAIVAYIMAENLHRRHLDTSQRAMIAAEMGSKSEGRPAKTASIEAVSQADKAKQLNISRSAVQRAEVVKERGTAELRAAVKQGKVPVSVAEKVARMPVIEQERFVAQVQTSAKPAHQIIAQMRRNDRRSAIVEQCLSLPSLATLGQRYPVIYADPPWRYEQQQMGHTDRGVENHYPTMSLEDICAMPVKDIATDDAVLFLWSTIPCQKEAFAAMEAWGFTYKSGMVWIKDRIGMGFYVRNRHELLLIGVRGAMTLPDESDRPDSVLLGGQGEHSAKPATAYERIERMYPQFAKIELFARVRRENWAAWGYEAPLPPDDPLPGLGYHAPEPLIEDSDEPVCCQTCYEAFTPYELGGSVLMERDGAKVLDTRLLIVGAFVYCAECWPALWQEAFEMFRKGAI